MSTKIAKDKEWIKKAYQERVRGEDNRIYGLWYYRAHFYSLGYIKGLEKARGVTIGEANKLYTLNDTLCADAICEEARKENKERENKKEGLKKMEWERIRKRIDESIRENSSLILPHNISLTRDMIEKHAEGNIALHMYKELITNIHDVFGDRALGIIQNLEEKYYPRPKTIKEKLDALIKKYSPMPLNQGIYLMRDLKEIMDSIDE